MEEVYVDDDALFDQLACDDGRKACGLGFKRLFDSGCGQGSDEHESDRDLLRKRTNRDRSDRLLVEWLACYGATVVTGAGTSVSDVGESSPDRFTSMTISTTTARIAATTVPTPDPLFCVI